MIVYSVEKAWCIYDKYLVNYSDMDLYESLCLGKALIYHRYVSWRNGRLGRDHVFGLKEVVEFTLVKEDPR